CFAPRDQALAQCPPVRLGAQVCGQRCDEPGAWAMADRGKKLVDAHVVDRGDLRSGVTAGGEPGAEPQGAARVLVRVVQFDDIGRGVSDSYRGGQSMPPLELVDSLAGQRS